MSKQALIERVYEKTSLSQKGAADAVETILAGIKDLAEKGPLQLRGFGTFRIVERAARKGRNPKTQEAVEVPSRKVLKFKPVK